MLTRIWNGLIPADCWDLERRRVVGTVRAVAMSFVVGILPALYLQWANNWVKGFVILLATEAASLLALALNQRGKSELAAETLSWAGFLCACSMVYFSRAGYRDLALLLFPAMLATGALLLSKRPYIVYAIFVVVAAATLIFLQVHGLNPFARQSGSYFDLLNVAIILTLISFALGLLSNAMRRSVADHRALIEQAGEGVIVLDHRRLIRMCNSSAANILGVAAPGLLGRSFQDFHQPLGPVDPGRGSRWQCGQGIRRIDSAAPGREFATSIDDMHAPPELGGTNGRSHRGAARFDPTQRSRGRSGGVPPALSVAPRTGRSADATAGQVRHGLFLQRRSAVAAGNPT